MKKLILYVVGAVFLFASCQTDELQSDELVQTDDPILLKVTEAYENYKSKNKTDWSQIAKSSMANQVARNWTMKYSYATRFDILPNPDACAGFGSPTLELQIDGYGLGSLFGNFTFINRLCIQGEEEMRGVGTAANGDQWYFFRTEVDPDEDNPGYEAQYWEIRGGSPGGRFEEASGWLVIYGNPTSGDPNDPTTQEPFVGSGVFIY